jgi:uncharacterized protein YndB with AHSA1/START domain
MATTESLELSYRFEAPREEVFRAWTNPEQVRKWWAPPGLEAGPIEIDLRPGGSYRLTLLPPAGEPMEASGVYHEVDPPARLVYSWAWRGGEFDGLADSIVTVEFRELGVGATEVVVVHEQLPPEAARAHDEGWRGCFERLAPLVSLRKEK